MKSKKGLDSVAEMNTVDAAMVEQLDKLWNRNIVGNITMLVPRDINKINKSIPKALFAAWFARAVVLITHLAGTSDEEDFEAEISTFVGTLPEGYFVKFTAAFPFHGQIKDRIIRAILASKTKSIEAKRVKEEYLQYLIKRKSTMHIRLGSDIHISTKLKGERLCQYLYFLGCQILTPGRIKGLPTSDEVRLRAMDMLLSGNKDKVSLYNAALKAVERLRADQS